MVDAATTNDENWMTWHRHLGHIGRESLIATLKHAEIKTPSACPNPLPTCEACVEGRKRDQDVFVNLRKVQDNQLEYYTDDQSGSGSRTARMPLDIVVADIAGPYKEKAQNEARFLLLIVDVYTRYMWVYPLQRTEQAALTWEQWYDEVDITTCWEVRTLRTENRPEFLGGYFQKFLQTYEVTHETTTPGYMQVEGMGIVKRAIRTIEEMVRPMLLTAPESRGQWGHAAQYAGWIINRIPRESMQGVSPYYSWHKQPPLKTAVGKKPDLSRAGTFGDAVMLDEETTNSLLGASVAIYLRPHEENDGRLGRAIVKHIVLDKLFCIKYPQNPDEDEDEGIYA